MAHEHNSINVKSDMESNKTIEKSLNLNNNNNSNNNNNNNFQPSMMAQIFKYENDYNRSSAMKTQQIQNSQVPVNNTINTNMNINNINTTSSSSSSSLLSPSLSSLTTTTTTAQNVSGPAGVGGGNGCGGVLGVGCGSSNSNSNVNGNTASGSAKMGSRRIFTPQFKLQVLQSYRIDSDCKGNQRATARKYGIHRRQIQKWLQCEPNLRSTVDNLNQNNIKHLFHNISPQMPIVKISNKPPQHLTISGNNNNNNNNSNNNNNNNVQLSLDTARHSVALASKAMPSSTSSSITTSFGGNNLSGASAVSSSTSISPLRPITTKCINGGSGGNSNTMTVPILPHSTPYKLSSNDSLILTHTPASLTSVPVVPVPMQHIHANLNTHYQSQHHQHHQHQQHLQQFHPQHHHNHHHHQHHHHQHHQRLPFMPSACLPVLSTCISPIPIQSSIPAIPTTTTTITTTVCHDDIVSVDGGNSTGNRYINDNDYMKDRNQQIYDGFHYYSHNNNNHNHNYIQETAISDGVAPIDLSVGPKNRQTTDNNVKPFTSESIFQSKSVEFASNSNMDNENKDIAKNENQTESIADENLVVDLTCRKRKNCNSYDTDVDIDVTPEKLQKVIKINNDEKKSFKNENLEQHLPSSQHQQQQEQQPQQQQAAKPVKLFKPYLMDDDDDKKSSSSSTITTALTLSSSLSSSSNTGCGIEQQYPIIWSHHPNCITPGSYDSGRQCSSRGSNFQSNDSYPFPSGSPIFHGPTIFTTTVPIVSPATTPTAFSCPKGSPVSGYESSSSTYSDSIRSEFYNSCRRINSNDTKSPTSINAINQQQQPQHLTQHHHPHHTYSIDLKMQPIIHNGYYYDAINDNHQLQHRNHVQQWLDQGTDIRQPLADYV